MTRDYTDIIALRRVNCSSGFILDDVRNRRIEEAERTIKEMAAA